MKKAKVKKRKPTKRVSAKLEEKSFHEIISSAGSDWATANLSIDAEVFQSVFSLRAAMRDLWRCNPYLAKYQEQLAANVFGESGIMLRSKIKETEDRVVYAADDPERSGSRERAEMWALIAHERKINRLRKWAEEKTRTKIEQYRAFHLADRLSERSAEAVFRGQAHVEVGAPDVYAIQRVESWWKEFQKAKFCDVRKARDYNTLRQLRLWSAARDGGHFIQTIKGSNINALGFTLRHINDEWVDHFYNTTLENGNVVRMGIEYQNNAWGIGEPVAYHFIKRMPRDWQTSARYSGNGYGIRDRVPAEQIIHYARVMDNESTRPAPWGVSMLGKVRQLDQYEIAEVVAARMQACVTGWLYSTINPEGGLAGITPDPATAARGINVAPGGLYGLPYGVEAKFNDPTHPSGNFQNFRQGMGQSIAAALPGGDYNIIFNDLANINFSAGRLGRLDTNEINKMLQRFDINLAEQRIFEEGLEMALIVGAIPLPLAKLKKFKAAEFQGRRWAQVDEGKAVDAAAKRIANKLSSRSRECAEEGVDFEDNAFELAEEEMLLEQLGLRMETTAQQPLPEPPKELEDEDDDEEGKPPKANGKEHPALDLPGRIAINA
jgi:lambda family phage portal protein